MIRLKNILIVLVILVIVITALVFTIVKFGNDIAVAVSGSTLSNKKMGWGVKRNKNQVQPDLGKYKQIIDKYDGIAMGNPNDKIVYLTFDAGYEAGYTPQILDVLKENNVKATFFITAYYLDSKPELVKRMLDEGHIVGNHTVNHYSLPDISDDKIKKEIQDLHVAIYDKFGYEMKYFRPPKGEFSERTLEITRSLGYTSVMWSLAYDDYTDSAKAKGDDYAKSMILNNIHPGAVILLHSTSKINADVLDYCIKEIKNMGYEFKNIDEFVK